MNEHDIETLPIISRGEQRAIEKLFAGSFNLMDCLRGFVRNRRALRTDEPFTGPLERLFEMSEAALESVGFWPETETQADARKPVGSLWREYLRQRKPVDITLAHLVIIESPFAGQLTRNIAYARQCVRDSLLRGEHPIASHLLYTQPGVLDDDKPEERERGIEAGLAWRRAAQKAVFYTGLGWSSGMRAAQAVYDREGFPYEERDMIAVPPGVTYPSNMPFPADPFGLSDKVDTSDIPETDKAWFDGSRLVMPEELEPLEVAAQA